MRISTQNTVDISQNVKTNATVPKVVKQGSLETTNQDKEQIQQIDATEITEEKIQQVINTLNEVLEINHNSSKFIYHEGLDRYFIQVINKDTDEVVKEIPPKKLLDAFFELQKMVGMIVDEKI